MGMVLPFGGGFRCRSNTLERPPTIWSLVGGGDGFIGRRPTGRLVVPSAATAAATATAKTTPPTTTTANKNNRQQQKQAPLV
jgi:hypothetical protein